MAMPHLKISIFIASMCMVGQVLSAPLLETKNEPQLGGFDQEVSLDRAAQKQLKLQGRAQLQQRWLYGPADEGLRRLEGYVGTYGRNEALEQRRRLNRDINPGDEGAVRKRAGIAANRWQSVGPKNIGARVRTIAQHPNDANTLWLGAASGGVWKTVNGGSTWVPVSETLGSPEIADIRLDPALPNRIYVATGEVVYGARGAGIYRSDDAGTSWTSMTATLPSSHSGFRWMGRLAVHPNQSGRMWLAAAGGVYSTTDGWSSYTRVWPTAAVNGDWIGQGYADIEIDPNNSSKLIAGSLRGRISLSPDGGGVWSDVQLVPWSGGYLRVEVAYAKSVPGRVYASTQGGVSQRGRFFVSADGGLTWTERTEPAADVVDPYKNLVWVDPLDGDHVIVGGTELRRSFDGGLTWVQYNSSSEATSSAGFGARLHYDQHIVISDIGYSATSRHLFVGTDGGIYRINDARVAMPATTAQIFANGWQPLNGGLSINQLYSISATAGRVVSGSQDQSVAVAATGITTNLTQQALGGDVVAVATDPSTSFNFYLYQWMEVARFSGTSYAGGDYRICHQLKLGTGEFEGTCAGQGLFRSNFRAPMVFDDVGVGGRLLVGGNNLWRSTNPRDATTTNVAWQSIKAPSAVSGNYIAVIGSSASNPDTVWVAHNNGELYRSSNAAGASPGWTAVVGPTARGNVTLPTSIYVDPITPSTVYLTFGWFGWQNLWRTTNGNDASPTWTAVGVGVLPLAPFYGVSRHPSNPQWLYLASEVGVFTSEDSGSTWFTTNDGPRNAAVTQLKWAPGQVLYAASYGLSGWKLDLSDDFPNSAPAALAVGLDSTTAGRIEAAGDIDVLQVRFPGAGVWKVSTTGAIDTFGTVIAADQVTTLASDDNSGGGGNFRIVRNVARADTHYVAVSALGGATGDYSVVSQFTPAACTLDIDGDGTWGANDATLVLRYAFGFRGAALTTGLTFAANALRTDATIITNYIAGQSFNVDGNGTTLGATTDALMLARILRGFSGAETVLGTVGAAASNADWNSVRQFLNTQCLTGF